MAITTVDGDTGSEIGGAGAGTDDRYVFDGLNIEPGQEILVSDTSGDNIIQLTNGLEIASSSVTSGAVQLTLNNGAVITVLDADTFTFQTGGNGTNGTGGTEESYEDFATNVLGVTVPAEGDPAETGGAVTVDDGTGGGDPTPPASGTELTADADDFEGTTGDDTFDAQLSAAGAQTLQTFDRIDGLDGTDTINATLDGSNDFLGANDLATAVENVENFFVRTLGGENVHFAGVDTVEQIWSDRSQGTLNTVGIENKVTLGVVEGEGGNFNATYAGPVVGDNLDSGRFTQDFVLDNADLGTLGVNGFGAETTTTANFALTGDSAVTLGGTIQANLDTVTTSGTGSLDLGFTGLPAVDLTATFGGGDDTLRLDGTTVDGNDDIDMGGGDDTLALTGIAAEGDVNGLDLSGVAGLENLTLVDALTLTGAATLELGELDGATFEAIATGGNNILTVESDMPDVTLSFEAGSATLEVETGEDITSVTVEAAADLDIDGLTNVAGTDSDSLTSIAVVDTDGDDTNALSHDIILGGANDLAGLTMIDLSDAGQDDDDVTIDASAATFDGPVTLMVGDADLDYTADAANKREVFQFAGEDINVIGLTDFVVTGAGNGDKLDFSMFSDVTGLGDLAIVDTGNDWEVSAADGEFDGTITLVGLGSGGDDVEQSTLEANAFIF